MIVHSFLQQLKDDGFGTVGTTLQMGILPLNADGKAINGIAVITRGTAVDRINTNIQAIDIYIRNTDPLTASNKAEEILKYLQDSFSEICTLPPLNGVTTESYTGVVITPVSAPDYVGVDENNGHSYVVSGEIRYETIINQGD